MKARVQRLGILGSGQMGRGIAEVAAQVGFEIFLADQSMKLAEAGKSAIADRLRRQVEKGKSTDLDQNRILQLIQPVEDISAFSKVGLVIEAVNENPALKFQLFKQLDSVCPPSTVIASNTSSISITAIASHTSRPDRIAGIHFMNPVPVMKLVEGIRGLQTSDEAFQAVREVAERMGKMFIEAKDQPGFVVNRILMPMINEAITAFQEGIASIKDIDTAMKLGTNQPMGPLELADFIGLDTCLAIMQVLHEGFGDPRYRPSPLLKQYVAAGWLGRKAKRGFYEYETQ